MTPGKEFVELDKFLHDRTSFDGGQAELNEFLTGSAARHREVNVSRTLQGKGLGKTTLICLLEHALRINVH